MANPSTLYRFRISAQGDRPAIDVRVAQHPSETEVFLITRMLAYVLNVEDGIEFGPGLSDPDAPAIRVIGTHGEIKKWIDIGNPSARRLHKSAKAAAAVHVYTYKDVERLKKEAKGEKIFNADKIKLFAVDSDFLEEVAGQLERDNRWQVQRDGDSIEVTIGDEVFTGSIESHRLE